MDQTGNGKATGADLQQQQVEHGMLQVYGAKEHNLKNLDVSLPRNELIVFTGISGSGKSSLAFDTLYAEGQRRYMETFQAYLRQFVGNMKRPEVDKIEGLSPVISIEQKTVSKNPRSTVGTITEVYDFLRLLYARASTAYSYISGKPMVRFSDEQIIHTLTTQYANESLYILAPLIKARKGHYRELFEQYRKLGFTKVRVDGELRDIKPGMKLTRYKMHDIELIVDRVKVNDKSGTRIKESVQTALRQGRDTMMVLNPDNPDSLRYFSRNLMCPDSGIAYEEPQPNTFSFNSPYGYCPDCKGTGETYQFSREYILPDLSKSITKGGLHPIGTAIDFWLKSVLKSLVKRHRCKLSTPIRDFPEELIQELLYGTEGKIKVETEFGEISTQFEGLIDYYQQVLTNGPKTSELKRKVEELAELAPCPTCQGYRLNQTARHFLIDNQHIGEVSNFQLNHFYDWIQGLEAKMTGQQQFIAREILKEIAERTRFLLDVGLKYLSLNRPAYSLSGGEAQRIRLATQVGSQLINVLYILDEPSIGLHQRDNHRLTDSLKSLRDIGNTVIVVEHDRDMMLQADYLLDLGPGAGKHGGYVVEQGRPQEVLEGNSMTAQYLKGRQEIALPEERRQYDSRNILRLRGATGNNLQNLSVDFPLSTLICVTGVSGSGKSSLINDTLYPTLKRHFYRSFQRPLPYKKVQGLDQLDKVIEISQSPIGRTPRSNPLTYTGVFSDIRRLFAELPEAKIRGYKMGRFSFNVKGGRCETCKGAGVKTIEMKFLPDVYTQCPDCLGRRYNRQTLEVRYKGKSISDVLDMTVEEAVKFFENIPNIKRKLKTLDDVGLGYVHLGQPSTTLSGGEAQRVKLATELAKKDTGKTFYILDEPTTGLHFEDIRILMNVLNKLVDKGNTVLIIEHNLDVVKLADHVIDIGPEGGDEGGKVVAKGTPEAVAKQNHGHTGRFLKKELEETVNQRELAVLEA